MPLLVAMGAKMLCGFGTMPATLTVTPENMANSTNKPIATIMDHVLMKNIASFGMCSSLANPQVSAAISAASGVLTPQPCIPATSSHWAPGSTTVMLKNNPVLNLSSKCMCNLGGVISIIDPGQQKAMVP